jgi:sigma-B regulation protein RsbU (phosphoserine phosphatase)
MGRLEVCKRIRRDFPDCCCDLILLTSNSEKEQIVEGLAAGADDYLTKPIHSGGLWHASRQAVGLLSSIGKSKQKSFVGRDGIDRCPNRLTQSPRD